MPGVSPPARAFPTRLFLFAFLGWTFDFYDLVLFGFIKDPVARSLGLAHRYEPWLLGVALSTSGVGGIIAGRLADRIGKRSVLSITIFAYSLGSLVCGLSGSVWTFILGRALVGLGVGGEWAVGHGMVAEAVAAERRGRASALLQAGEPVGVGIAAVVGYLIVPLVGWRAVLIGSSAPALIAFAPRNFPPLPGTPPASPPPPSPLLPPRNPSPAPPAPALRVFQ